MQRFIFMARLRHRAFVAPDAIALGILAYRNPIVDLLKLALFHIRVFGAEMHPRFTTACVRLNHSERGQFGLGPKRVVHETVNASKRRLLAAGFRLPSFATVKAYPHLFFDGNLSDGISIFGFDGEIEIVAAKEPMHAKLKRSIEGGVDFPGSTFH